MPEGESSFCDMVRGSTSKILKEMELQTPMHFQLYSDMYKEYLHLLDNVFGMCMVAEREVVDRLGVGQGFLAEFDRLASAVTDGWLRQINNYGSFLQWYSQVRSSGIKSNDRFMHSMISAYAQTLEGVSRMCHAGMAGRGDVGAR